MKNHKQSDINLYQTEIRLASSSDELHALVNEIIEHFGSFPHALLPAYKNKLGGGIGPVSGSLHRVIADTESKELYAKYKSYLTEFDVMNMMSSGFYHEELEEKFCQQAYQWIKNQAYKSVSAPTWIISKLNALAASGRALTLDTMENMWQEISRASSEVQTEREVFERMELWHLRKMIPEWKNMISRRMKMPLVDGSSNGISFFS